MWAENIDVFNIHWSLFLLSLEGEEEALDFHFWEIWKAEIATQGPVW